MSLLKQKEDFGQKRKNWVEPLREWIKLSSEAEINAKSQNYHKLKQVVEKIGTNRLLLNRKVQMDFSEPWRFAASRLAGRGDAEGRSREATSSENLTCLEWSGQAELNRYYTHPKGTDCRYPMARTTYPWKAFLCIERRLKPCGRSAGGPARTAAPARNAVSTAGW